MGHLPTNADRLFPIALIAVVAMLLISFGPCAEICAQDPSIADQTENPATVTQADEPEPTESPGLAQWVAGDVDELTSPDSLPQSIKLVALVSILSLAPAIGLMTTSFVRIAVVLGLLRQALGTQQLPSNQVITALALFMTLFVMMPVWKQVNEQAIQPYTAQENPIAWEEAVERGVLPIKEFMCRQINAAGNIDDVWLFYRYLPADQKTERPEKFGDIPLSVLLPAFLISELKIAFLLGFQLFVPFLILDIVVASVTTSMGMMMLPPMMISLPLKLVLFVLVDGWTLVVGMLLTSTGIVPT